MAFNFEQVLNDALGKGIAVARTGGPQIEDWVRQSVQANRDSLASIAEGVVKKEISKETAEYLLKQNGRALQAEAAALNALITATAQGAINAFLDSLYGALRAGLKLAL